MKGLLPFVLLAAASGAPPEYPVVSALSELAEELLEAGFGPGVAGLVHGAAPPEPEPPGDGAEVVDLRRWAECRGRWSAVPCSLGRRAA